MLKIELLGGIQLTLDGAPLPAFPSRKADALLVYLICQNRPVPRETLADILWDDRPVDQAMANLRSILSSLRRTLPDYISANRQTVQFNGDSDHWFDVATFAELLPTDILLGQEQQAVEPAASQQLEAAIKLYRGSFLDGFYVRESRRFDEWVTLERERLRRQATLVLRRLVNQTLHTGRYTSGIEYANQLLRHDSLSEEAHRSLMLLLIRNGQRSAALAQYERCRQLLETELGVAPMPETQALRNQIEQAAEIGQHNLPPQTTPFVGRENELVRFGQTAG